MFYRRLYLSQKQAFPKEYKHLGANVYIIFLIQTTFVYSHPSVQGTRKTIASRQRSHIFFAHAPQQRATRCHLARRADRMHAAPPDGYLHHLGSHTPSPACLDARFDMCSCLFVCLCI